MKIVPSLLLFCFILFGFVPCYKGQTISISTYNKDPVGINFVSTVISTTASPLTGSLQGGTTLYIQGYGFDETP